MTDTPPELPPLPKFPMPEHPGDDWMWNIEEGQVIIDAARAYATAYATEAVRCALAARPAAVAVEPLLSNMDRGVLTMPCELAMSSELSRVQFYQRVQSLVARIDAAALPQDARDAARYRWLRDKADQMVGHDHSERTASYEITVGFEYTRDCEDPGLDAVIDAAMTKEQP